MKVSSIIKTPVKATQFNSGTASVRAENGSGVIVASTMTHEFGHAIAHAINSHDRLVEFLNSNAWVGGRPGNMAICVSCGVRRIEQHQEGCEIADLLKEANGGADELLKGEDG